MKASLTALLLIFAQWAQAETWYFGLIGDVPYSDYERAELPRMIKAINDDQVSFIAHIGDIKSGKDRCDDTLFRARHADFSASAAPFIFIPGDNEWSDCDRASNGAYQPLERLAKLRDIFWKDAYSLGDRKIPLERQAGAYVEHSRFRLGPVLFVTLNLPGGNNNFGLTDEPSKEFQSRNPKVLAWVKENFALARREKLAGIALLFQANPGFKHYSKGLGHRSFLDFLNLLRQETMTFPGQVLVVHGDSHNSQVDHPLRDDQGKKLANFTRVETFGYPDMGWTRGTIDTGSPTLFHFEPQRWSARAQ